MVKEIIIYVVNIYLLVVSLVIIVYFLRHYRITINRILGKNKIDYSGIIDDEYEKVTIVVPMHNEEKVIDGIMNSLLRCDYPHDKLEIIGVNDHSTDKTKELLDKYVELSAKNPDKYPVIKAFHRDEGAAGKQNALNDAIEEMATGDIILVFDADYLPPRDIIRSLAMSFKNPKVGAVMGRVIPVNTSTNFLTRLEDLERTGGYQVDQQAKYNLDRIPLYGGTVGGFRKQVFMEVDKFSSYILAEDTDLTYKLNAKGYDIVYANSAECYEEVPEDWAARAKQIARWSRGHNAVLFTKFFKFFFSKKVSCSKRHDGTMTLFIYTLPMLWWIGWFASMFLFYVGDVGFFAGLIPLILTLLHGSMGNFAPFFQIAMGCMADGSSNRIKLLPWFFVYFAFSLWYTSVGFCSAVVDIVLRRAPEWDKTQRVRKENTEITQEDFLEKEIISPPSL